MSVVRTQTPVNPAIRPILYGIAHPIQINLHRLGMLAITVKIHEKKKYIYIDFPINYLFHFRFVAILMFY